nr:M20/M25/M40 family metallo-hydrolase [Anaerolineae bacterium]
MSTAFDDLLSRLRQPETAMTLLDDWNRLQTVVIEEILALQAIPAPTFEEKERAAYTETRFRQVGLDSVGTDTVGNVYARLPGKAPSLPAVLVSAHLDTVFPRETDLTIRRDEAHGRIYGPGIGDNCAGLAALICLASRMVKNGYRPPGDIWWVATVGEEGLGDLRGIREAVARLRDKLGVAVIIEGTGLGTVYNAGLGVKRLKVTIDGPGGHSWHRRESPSAIHQLVTLGAALVTGVDLSGRPARSLNIGIIEGGTSINTRAAHAQMGIDLRSVDANALLGLEKQVRAIIDQHAHEPALSLGTSVVSDRPSATLSPDHPLVLAALGAIDAFGFPSATLSRGSTDANITLHTRIPSVCIGITTGGKAHTTDEYIDIDPVATGMKQLSLLTLLACDHVSDWRNWQEQADNYQEDLERP